MDTELSTKRGNETELSSQEALHLVAEAMNVVRFGEIVIKIQNGKPVFVDALKRERVG